MWVYVGMQQSHKKTRGHIQDCCRAYPQLLSIAISSTKLLHPSLLLFAQIRELLHFGFVQTIDDGILPLLNMDALNLALNQYIIINKSASVCQAPRTSLHKTNVTDLPLILKPNLTHRHTPIFLQITPWCVNNRDVILLVALDTIRLGQLRTVHQQLCSDLLPILALWQPHVDMRRRQVVDVEPHIFFPAVLD
jgi:hypothetical protein